MPKVSVIIPVYNVENYIRKCLDSIISQSLKDIEIILVDDGSEDNSGKICDEYAEKDSRIIVIHQENQGVSVARNKGIINATGEYIGFVDPDDYVEINMFEILYTIAKTHNIDIVNCGYYDFILDTDKVIPTVNFGIESNKIINKNEINEFIRLFKIKSINNSITKIYKKSLLIDNNIFFIPRLQIQEDTIFVLQALIHAKNIYFIDKALYYYVKRENSLTTTKYRRNIFLHFDYAYNKIVELYKVNNFSGYEQELLQKTSLQLLSILKREKYNKDSLFKKTTIISNISSTNMAKNIIDNFNNINKDFPNYKILKLIIYLLKYKMYFAIAILTYFS